MPSEIFRIGHMAGLLAVDKGNTSSGYDRTPRLVYTAPAAGDYFVCVSNWIGDLTASVDTSDDAALKAYSSVTSTGSASISIVREASGLLITYTGVLQSPPNLGLGTFTDVPDAVSPYSLPLPTTGTLFFRARP